MLFCPTCSNLLYADHVGGAAGFVCLTCPYKQEIVATVSKSAPLATKEVDDVLGGKDAWKNVDQTAVTCDECGNGHAYFMQIQIRSADEPMTLFYKCTKCSHRWND